MTVRLLFGLGEDMRSYWIRIVAGSLGIFAIGMVGWNLIIGAKGHVEHVIESSDPLAIPLPFDLVPFQVDGHRMGSLKRLVLHREGPREINWVEIDAELGDAQEWPGLADCQLALDDLEGLDENSSFICHPETPADYTEFGEIHFREVDESLVFLLPRTVVSELRDADRSRIERQHARMYERQVIIAEEQARMASELSAEAAATVARAISEAFADSIPARVRAELEAAGVSVKGASAAQGGQGIRVEIKSADSAGGP